MRQATSAAANANAPDRLDGAEARARFIEAMDDDMNSPQAVAALFDLAREINRGSTEGRDVSEAQAALIELTGVLGLTLEQRGGVVDADLAARAQVLVDKRAELRAARDFAGADAVRDELAAMGIEVTDSPSGTTWRVVG